MKYNKALSHTVILLLLLLVAPVSMANTNVRIAVLAFRPAADVQQRWHPLVDYFEARLPGYSFHVEAYNYKQLETVIARNDVDFVLTNPSHYILMTYRNGLSSPLATLVPKEKERNLAKFGGVVIARSDRNDIRTLRDLRGLRIAVVTKGSLGGYQAQAVELSKVGVKLPGEVKLMELGMPHDLVVKSVLDGSADAGFVRTGVLEDMAGEGKVDLANIKVLAAKNVSGFPLLLSTQLFPEWPFAAMPGVDENLARQVAALLLSIPHDGELAGLLGIHGFTIPTDYESVRSTLETLRLPPFDAEPRFTAQDIWNKYYWELLVGFLLITLIGLLTARLFLLNRKLQDGRLQLQNAAKEWHRLLTALGEGVYGVDENGRCTFINPAALAMIGFSRDDVLGRDQHALFHHHHEDGSHYPGSECPISLTLHDGVARSWEDWFWRKDGTGFPVMLTTAPMGEDGGKHGTVVVFRDISQQRQLEKQLRIEATTDPLTGVSNRRMFLHQLTLELGRYKRFGEPVSVLMLDIDHFKKVNDNYGHATGDLVLKHFTDLCRLSLRSVDIFGRLGGEEFGAMLPVTDMVEALAFAERLRRLVCETPAQTTQGEISFTVSIGITEIDFRDNSPDEALERADAALYRAKERGRNTVEISFTENSKSLASGDGLGRSLIRLRWKQKYKCGQDTIDDEHQELFRLANQFLDQATTHDVPRETVLDVFDMLLQHVADHFQHEESILHEHGSSAVSEHEELHKMLIERAMRIRQQAEDNTVPLGDLVEFIVAEVIAGHLLHEDMKFYGLFNHN